MASIGDQTSVGDDTQRDRGAAQGTATPDTSGEDTDEGLSKSEAFDVLRNSRRRSAIASLRENGGRMSIRELTKCVAAREYDVDPEALTADQYKRVYTGLYQCHLERADDFGVVDFDTEENTVELRDQAAALDPYLGGSETDETVRVELAVAAITTLLVALGAVAAGPLSAIPMTVVVGLPILSLVGLSLLQLS